MAAQAVLNHQIWRWLGLGDRLASNPAATATAAASTFTSSANATASSAASQAAQATSSSLGLWAHAKQSVSSGATFVVDGVRTALWDTDGLYQAQEAAMYKDGRVPCKLLLCPLQCLILSSTRCSCSFWRVHGPQEGEAGSASALSVLLSPYWTRRSQLLKPCAIALGTFLTSWYCIALVFIVRLDPVDIARHP